jgi:hypothetical protein
MEEITVETLKLPWGYRAERDGSEIRLMDPVGRLVAWFAYPATRIDPREAVRLDRSRDWAASTEGWQGLCRLLVVRLFEQARECADLRQRIQELSERLEEVEAERDQANEVAATLLAYFRRETQEAPSRKRRSRREEGSVE